MTGVTNADIMMKLGQTLEGIEGLRRDMDKADESRKTLYLRLEDQARLISDVQFEGQKQTGINSQIRDALSEFNTVQNKMREDMQPLLGLKEDLPKMVEAWKDLRKSSQRVVFLLTLGGVSVVGVAIWFGGLITQAVQHWLGIAPGH